ncbi:MAG: alpha/beta fold hydrolase, partial [Acidobacteriota bacterium]
LGAILTLATGCVSLTPYSEIRATVPEGSLIRLNDHLVHVVDRGPLSRSGDPAEPVVFVHGFGASTYSWRHVLDELPGYRTIALDLNGFGYTERPEGLEPYTRRGQVELIRDVLDRLGIERAHLVGHSYGGGVTLAFAHAYPERLRSLTLVASTRPDYPETRRKVIAAFEPLVDLYIRSWALRRRWVRRALEHSVADDSLVTPELVDAYLERLRIEGAERAYYGVTAPTEEPEQEVRLEEIQVPVLAVWGAEDSLIPVALGREAVGHIPCSRFVVLPETGHLPMEEHPAELVAAIRAFLPEPRKACPRAVVVGTESGRAEIQ